MSKKAIASTKGDFETREEVEQELELLEHG
jgi:hypothetical protein